MGTRDQEVRCKSCSILLAKLDDTGLTIRRGDMQATFCGDIHASLVCYRSRCRQLNVLRFAIAPLTPKAA